MAPPPSARTAGVVMKPLTIGRDMGAVVEIAAGLSPGDRVIDTPPDSLRPGDPVRVMAANAGGAQRNAAR
ncbi:MAG: hypothetical protein WDM92_10360 [Caulobacteraceae bacterium]